MKKLKVFCSNCLSIWSQKVCYVTPINWLLKLHHKKFAASKDQYEWTEPYFLIGQEYLDNEAAYNMVVEEGIDVVAFSVYIWNRKEFFEMARYFKERNPNLTIIMGGPDIDAHRDSEFFSKNPFIDWVIYGEGEIAFSRLLDHLQGHPVELINVVAKDGTVYPHEPVNKKEELLSISPYIEFKDEMVKFFLQFQEKQIFYALAWETTKGCPYLCTFCDWSSGLHHKVRIWGKDELIPAWKRELNLFSEMKVPGIYWTNPNVGLAPQDAEIVDYICQLKREKKHVPIFISTQFSKTKKEHSYSLMDKLLSHYVMAGLKFDLQDLDPVVLDLIDRPEIPWDEHKALIRNILQKHGKDKVWGENPQPVWCNFIWGLPGQTLMHMRRNMAESGELGMFPTHHIFECLPNSPAATPEYQTKHGMRIREIYLNIADGIDMQPGPISSHSAKAVVETSTLSTKDWFKGVFIFNIYGCLTDYASAFSKNKGYGLGKEQQCFDNILLTLDSIINDSFDHFLETSRIEVMFNGIGYGFQNFVEPRREYLMKLFDDSDTASSSVKKILGSEYQQQNVEYSHKTRFGLTPENLLDFVEEKG